MTVMDLQAVVDLTAEALNHKSMPIRLKNVLGGRANKSYITLPKWIQKYVEAFQIYYMVHYIRGCMYHHDSDFKLIEDKALALWGITIQRKRAYPKGMQIDGKHCVCP